MPSNSELASSSVFIEDLTVCKLKQALRLRKLALSGSRTTLLQRLRQAVDLQKQKERDQYERGLDVNGMPCAAAAFSASSSCAHKQQKKSKRSGAGTGAGAARPLLSRLSQSLMFAIVECLPRNSVLQLACANRDMQRIFSMSINGTPSAYMLACSRLCISTRRPLQQFTATQLKSLFQRMVGLKEVDLKSRYLTPLALNVLGQRATRLQSLSVDLRVCDRFGNVLDVIAMAHSCSNLRRLELVVPFRIEEKHDWRRLSEPAYQLHQLHELQWSGASENIPYALLDATPNLRSLHLYSDDEVPLYISSQLPHLTELTLATYVDEGLERLMHCTTLRKLSLGIDYNEMEPFVIDAVQELCLRNGLPSGSPSESLVARFPNVRRLVLHDSYGGDRDSSRSLAFPLLRELDVHLDLDFLGCAVGGIVTAIAEQPDYMPDLERVVLEPWSTSSQQVSEVVKNLQSARGKLQVIIRQPL